MDGGDGVPVDSEQQSTTNKDDDDENVLAAFRFRRRHTFRMIFGLWTRVQPTK